VSVTDRWIAFLRHRADAQLNRANLDAMRHGLLPAGWVYGLNDQRQAQFDEQRHILLESSKFLFRESFVWPPTTFSPDISDMCCRRPYKAGLALRSAGVLEVPLTGLPALPPGYDHVVKYQNSGYSP
jgi:hypothetical protein